MCGNIGSARTNCTIVPNWATVICMNTKSVPDPNQRESIVSLLEQGYNHAEIGVRLGISRQRVSKLADTLRTDPTLGERTLIANENYSHSRRDRLVQELTPQFLEDYRGLSRRDLRRKYGKTDYGKKLLEIHLDPAYPSEVQEESSLVGQTFGSITVLEFLGYKLKSGGFSKTREEIREDGTESTLYYRVKCNRCESVFPKQKHTIKKVVADWCGKCETRGNQSAT